MTSRRFPRVSAQAHQLNAKALGKALKKLAKTLGGSDNETSKAMEMLHIDATEELNLTSVNRGIMGMQCLSQPTFFTWLRWRSRAMREESGKKGDDAKWLIDPAIVRLPIYLKWRHEIVRIRKGIKAKKIIHGDLHQMNFVFHVAGFCQPGSREYFKVHNDPERKRRLMEAIEQGPAGPAKLYMVDFGRARKVNGIILRALHSIFLGEQRLPDPEMEPRSD